MTESREGQARRARSKVFTLVWALCAVVLGLGCSGYDHTHADHHSGRGERGHDRGRGSQHEGHGDHPHEEGQSITRWSAKVELFAEHAPAIAGKAVELTVHLTKLDDFSPVRGGKVRIELSGPEPLRAETDRMVREGIYTLALEPRKAGRYSGQVLITAGQLEDRVEGIELEVHANAKEATAGHEGAEKKGGNGVQFLKEQQWRVSFATSLAETREVVPTVEVGATVTTPPGGYAELGAPVAGRLVAPKGGFPRPGAAVKAGQLLATVAPAPSSPEGAAQATLAVAEAEARSAAAQAGANRAERLLAEQAVAQKQVDDAKREAQVADEALRAARRAKQLFAGSVSGKGSGTWKIVAPISGVLDSIEANPGSAVSAGQHLFTILDATEIWLVARVPESDAARLQPARDAAYRVARDGAWSPLTLSGSSPNAELVATSRVVDPRSRTVEVTYRLLAPVSTLRVGGLVRVAVPAGDATRAVALPREAIVEEGGRSLVYVQREGETFEERAVRLGPRAGGVVAVLAGVEPGERVVSKGANVIRLSARAASGGGHGHVH